MDKKFSRRDFFKIASLTGASLALSPIETLTQQKRPWTPNGIFKEFFNNLFSGKYEKAAELMAYDELKEEYEGLIPDVRKVEGRRELFPFEEADKFKLSDLDIENKNYCHGHEKEKIQEKFEEEINSVIKTGFRFTYGKKSCPNCREGSFTDNWYWIQFERDPHYTKIAEF